MKKLLLPLLLCLMPFATQAAKKKVASDILVTDMRTERMTRPMSIDTPTPRLGWRIETNNNLKNVVQTAYHIIVASSPEKAEALEGDLWDATASSDQSQTGKYATVSRENRKGQVR